MSVVVCAQWQEMKLADDFPRGAAVVVGGSGGIGAAICCELAALGSDVSLTYHRNKTGAEQVVDDIVASGGRAQAWPCDLIDGSAVCDLFAAVCRRWGSIHTVVCAAGPDLAQPAIASVTAAQWKQTVLGDLEGIFHLVESALPHLRQSRGSLVALSSAGVHRYPPGDILSVAPKAAIEALIRGIAREEGKRGVRANAVALGVIEAGQYERLKQGPFDVPWQGSARKNTALKRFGTPREVAQVVAFLASSRAAYVTGQTIVMDGGYSL